MRGDLTVRAAEPASETPAERLKLAIREKGTVKQIAEVAGVPLGTLNAYLAGGEMKFSNAVALAKAVNVSVDWLATGLGSGQAISIPSADVERTGNVLTETQGTVLISRYDARAAAGMPMMHYDSVVIEQIAFSESWVRTVLRRNPLDLALLEAHGDSMAPTIQDGDVLMIDASVNEIRSARIYILDVDGSLIVKRVQRLVTGGFKIISDNPRYDTEIFHPSERNPLRVIGEVVWHAGLAR